MTQYSISAFDGALAALGEYKSALSGIPDCIKAKASEIRLRCGYAPALSLASGEIYITDAPRVSREGLEDIFLHLCGHSVYSHQEEIARGYITISGGHRAGLAGQAVVEDGEIIALSEISSINLRIARQFIGCADEIAGALFHDRLCGALIVGPPCSGKTTLLRDIALALSSGRMSRPRKVTVVDERGEIAAMRDSAPQFDLGANCDVLDKFPKREGIMHAIRCLAPDVIICDEIGTSGECEAVVQGLNAGVTVISSIHASDERELLSRIQARQLLSTGAFEKLAFLTGAPNIGTLKCIADVEDIM